MLNLFNLTRAYSFHYSNSSFVCASEGAIIGCIKTIGMIGETNFGKIVLFSGIFTGLSTLVILVVSMPMRICFIIANCFSNSLSLICCCASFFYCCICASISFLEGGLSWDKTGCAIKNAINK